jgi:hypothetical protein
MHPRPQDNAVNLLGRPVGAQGFPKAVLSWDRMKMTTGGAGGYQWWLNLFGAGAQYVTLTDLVLPNPNSTAIVTHSSVDYHNHTVWTSGVLWLPVISEGATMKRWSGDSNYPDNFGNLIEGTVTITISELGRPA